MLCGKAAEEDCRFRWCTEDGCKSGQVVENGGPTCPTPNHTDFTDASSFFTCVKCQFKSCYSCRTPAHPTFTCAQYIAFLRSKEAPLDTKTKRYLQRHTMRCSTCNIPTMKTEGCDHMTCTVCKGEWCWRCGAKYTDIRHVGNSAHRRYCRHYRPLPGMPRRQLIRGTCIIT
jgi:hypothetical protein